MFAGLDDEEFHVPPDPKAAAQNKRAQRQADCVSGNEITAAGLKNVARWAQDAIEFDDGASLPVLDLVDAFGRHADFGFDVPLSKSAADKFARTIIDEVTKNYDDAAAVTLKGSGISAVRFVDEL